ncbi:hypothetical protein EX30DRAFT_396308 [Ascodesmis nigricans]|uniref:Uncharacterized protein n=1 Tax=Ascodesmis nigricans TaxID=341454 RepID=A0A4S2MVJ7_9PEZI|nr:hypothetical protein EX30DRAFT_396308 [Ascodesmis nigricans]
MSTPTSPDGTFIILLNIILPYPIASTTPDTALPPSPYPTSNIPYSLPDPITFASPYGYPAPAGHSGLNFVLLPAPAPAPVYGYGGNGQTQGGNGGQGQGHWHLVNDVPVTHLAHPEYKHRESHPQQHPYQQQLNQGYQVYGGGQGGYYVPGSSNW